MKFEWDEAKATSNLAKHNFSFNEAIDVFFDPRCVIVPSFRAADGESRFKAIGCVGDRLYSVVHTVRVGATRIISARRANPSEEKRYGYSSR